MDISLHRKQKLLLEIESSRRLLERGVHPLDVLDDFYHEILEMQISSLQNRYPKASREDLLEILRENVEFASKLSEKRKKLR